jgi:DNA polymerase III, epsilon subunit and related 3''-5'' exonucleases
MTSATAEVRFLPGQPSAESGEDAVLFERAIKSAMSHRRLAVFDIETGRLKAFEGRNPYGVEVGMEGLHPLVGRVILGGLLTHDGAGSWRTVIHGVNDERVNEATILSELIGALDECFTQGGEVVAHNGLGFDLPFILRRAELLEVAVPHWMKVAATEWRPQRFIDTLRVFEVKRFVQTGISLTDLADIWSRPFESFGADFGAQWENRDLRPTLVAYNVWNLRDTLALHAFLTDDLSPDTNLASRVPVSEQWAQSEGFSPVQEFEPLPMLPADVNVALWLVSPRPGLLEEGPSRRKGWASNLKEDTKLAYVSGAGRHDPRAVRIVGMVINGATGSTVVYEPSDEVAAIRNSLRELRKSIDRGYPVYLEHAGHFNRLLRLRLSRYGGLVPDGYASWPLASLPDSDLVTAWGKSRLGLNQDLLCIPAVTHLEHAECVIDHVQRIAGTLAAFATSNRALCES